MNSFKKHLKASIWMFFGIFFVFSTVILMNDDNGLLDQKKKTDSAEFSVAKVIKPKPKPKPKPKKKPKASKTKRVSPAPTLNSNLNGIDTGLDAFMSSDMDMDDALLGDVDKNVVMSEDSVDVAPKPTQRSAMTYPKKARKSGITGYVLMNLLVDKEGRVERVKILESEPDGVFDEVAQSSVEGWIFKPAQYKGQAVKVWAKQKIRFDLQ